ncbi:MAG: hypothetical protein ABFC18_03105 [Rikenellaceae bacterium]
MNQQIANIIKAKIEGLDFIDKIAGLVSTTYLNITDNEENKVTKSFPVACNVTAQDCLNGSYNDLCPNTKYKTVIYFEDGGVDFNKREGRFICYTSRLRLVCWINVAKYVAECCKEGLTCTASAAIIKDILCALPSQPEYISPYSSVYPVVTGQLVRSNSIFSAYTYNETQTQYLMAPFDYFALNIETTFCICMDECT